jgi:hypothetical protein
MIRSDLKVCIYGCTSCKSSILHQHSPGRGHWGEVVGVVEAVSVAAAQLGGIGGGRVDQKKKN